DDHPLIRYGLKSILLREANFKVVGEASNVTEAEKVIMASNANIALIDLELQNENGIHVVRKCRENRNECKFIMLSESADRDTFRSAIIEGVHGYLLKDALPEEILMALNLIILGRKYFDPKLLEQSVNDREPHGFNQLTSREREVLIALGQGLNNKQIAKKLFVAESTVKKHVSQILAKLELDGRTQVALYANMKGLA
ncbi:MAG: response regulator transcription factor, partial [Peptococcaceae bacterium]|nr:response regulator transcription factor [Peptococcaceae bacterium]